jgi:hypothetical protein
VTMAELNRASRFDRMADGVERVTGRPAMSVREFVSHHADEFGGRRTSRSATANNTPQPTGAALAAFPRSRLSRRPRRLS